MFGQSSSILAIDPSTGLKLEPPYPGGSAYEVEEACQLAWKAFDIYREISLETRAIFLETIANKIEMIGPMLIDRAMAESGLPKARLESERARTCGQLRLFANVVRSGEWLDVRIDEQLADRNPMPRADLRQRHIPLGPVAVFGASNFPLAFSVAGGDTASALAAGCPVIVKAHSAHPGTSELVGNAIQKAVIECKLPEGVFSLMYGSGREVGAALVADARIKAVGFTGSRSGGCALMKIAQSRNEPIPVYAEMSSINPVFVLQHALESRGDEIAKSYVASLIMGAGQFCTSPGLLIAHKSVALDSFVQVASKALKENTSQTMLTEGIYDGYQKGVSRLSSNSKVREVARGKVKNSLNQCQSRLFITSAHDFLNDKDLQEEIFGAVSLIIECDDDDDVAHIAEHLEGQLTATLQMDNLDIDIARKLLPIMERKAGRILVNGWPTGVEVCNAMVHGGPFPATSDSRSTSVGTASIFRFLRPVCYQDLPDLLRPDAIRNSNPLKLKRLVNGKRES
ncbi:aldehyde dehydrogenase (NADP(+)) [Marinomonas ushuaiensis]|nr:aldehyde dehydrogenase (NADP(+)) [Marinomonas ushuaiensis]